MTNPSECLRVCLLFSLGRLSIIFCFQRTSRQSLTLNRFADEPRLLKTWQDLLIECDADIVTGYNINNFDIPYLLDRANALRLDHYGNFGYDVLSCEVFCEFYWPGSQTCVIDYLLPDVSVASVVSAKI